MFMFMFKIGLNSKINNQFSVTWCHKMDQKSKYRAGFARINLIPAFGVITQLNPV